MEYRCLGNTNIRVSRLCFGSLTLGPLQGNLSLAQGSDLIRYALEQGVNFIDTAKYYQTYPYIRKALKGWDRQVIIASKTYDYTWQGMKQSVEEARLALDRDYIDLFMLHEQETALTLAGHGPALEYLGEAKDRGLVKAVGVSTHTVEVVEVAADRKDIEVVHPIVNYKGLGLLDGNLSMLMGALKVLYQSGTGIYGMKPLGGGNLIKNAPEALDFAFKNPYLHSVAVGCKCREELDYNICVLEGKEPSPQLQEKVNITARRLLIEEYCEGCGKCTARCPFGALEVKDGKAVLNGQDCTLCGYCGAVCPQFAIKVI